MPIRQKGLLEYIPATIHPGKDFHVSYYVINPDTNKLERKKVWLNRIKRVSDRKAIARRLAHTFNIKLAKGWNPFIEKGYVVILFNGFQKKTQKTPESEIRKAINLKNEYHAGK